MTIRPRRSMLFMPGSNDRALEKARTLPADGVIIDLEDSVAPERKDAAREAARAAVGAGFGAREVVVRINGLDTPWGQRDLAAVCPAAPDAILVPKIRNEQDVRAVLNAMERIGAPQRTRLWLMIETPLAVLNAQPIAATAAEPDARLSAFVLGANDLAKDTRVRVGAGRATILPWILQCVLAARAYGVDVLDSVYNDIADTDGFRDECAQGRELGMDGKTLIHPSQIDPCNAAFSPTPEEIAWAERVVAAFDAPENAGRGAISLDGRMVERLHAEAAGRVLALARATIAAS